jgi:hypothetical protein
VSDSPDRWAKLAQLRACSGDARAGDRELADDDGPIFSTLAKLVDALERAVPHSRDLELREEALRAGRELLRGAKYEEER